MKQLPILASVLILAAAGPGQELRKPPLSASIDSAVKGITGYDLRAQAPLTDDGEFLRRVMLDLAGYPPSAEQTRAFLAEANPSKRLAKVDEILAGEDWPDFWSRRFAEVFFGNYHDVTMDTMPKVSKSASTRIVGDFVRWFGGKLRKDAPWTEIVQQILEAQGTDTGDPALAWKLSMYKEEGHAVQFADSAGRQFLGLRLICARCHSHPFDKWDVEDYYGLAAFIVRERVRPQGGSSEKDATDHVEVKQAGEGEIDIPELKIDSPIVRAGKPGRAKPVFPYGGGAPPGPGDRMKALSTLMTHKSNTQLPRALANRVWGWLFARGIVDPVDDFKAEGSPPLSKPLLEALTRHLMESKYSIKSLVRSICASDAYQRSSRTEKQVTRADLARGGVKPLNGEQLLNSIRVATMGAPKRDTAQVLQMVSTLYPAGAVWCETTALPGNARQALLLRNNPDIMNWISSGGVLASIKSAPGSPEEKVDEMFLAAVSRPATESERKRTAAFLQACPGTGFEDAYWTILNSPEFLTRH